MVVHFHKEKPPFAAPQLFGSYELPTVFRVFEHSHVPENRFFGTAGIGVNARRCFGWSLNARIRVIMSIAMCTEP